MALELKGQKKRELRDALTDAYPGWTELRMMLDTQLDWKLPLITAESKGLNANAFELIEWAQGRGHLGDLVVASRNENPENPKLERFAASLGLSSAAGIPPANLERIVGSNATFLDVAKWRTALTRAEWRVCRVDSGGEGVGTGFLVGPDLVLTNYHVLKDVLSGTSSAASWSCRFDHKLSEAGTVISMGRVVKLSAEFRVDDSPYSAVDLEPDPKSGDPTDEQLDFALVRLAEPIGDQPVGKSEQSDTRGFVELSAAAVDYPSRRVIAILQHPRARPMKLALGMNETITTNNPGNRIRYGVPTEEGSSGSPVFDGDFNLIALHHAGDPKTVKPSFNEGIPIAKIASRPKVSAALQK